MKIREMCTQYCLPDPLLLLQAEMNKEVLKKMQGYYLIILGGQASRSIQVITIFNLFSTTVHVPRLTSQPLVTS